MPHSPGEALGPDDCVDPVDRKLQRLLAEIGTAAVDDPVRISAMNLAVTMPPARAWSDQDRDKLGAGLASMLRRHRLLGGGEVTTT
ncbi:hypothetical protein BN1232_05761 [Mycobacterium lentiflavum]|uniref:Uncharacterized protein n=1 Tax=Mycobacterium lentiflavum TaxID=141349 RepID=A0A0E4CQZ0_MYCLN|nr:hypothetical protein [Mycobacterium lentiflavum]CQD22854.1 hypothetical protein BN1232_05761 [Mycobacterium lentiflavum]